MAWLARRSFPSLASIVVPVGRTDISCTVKHSTIGIFYFPLVTIQKMEPGIVQRERGSLTPTAPPVSDQFYCQH